MLPCQPILQSSKKPITHILINHQGIYLFSINLEQVKVPVRVQKEVLQSWLHLRKTVSILQGQLQEGDFSLQNIRRHFSSRINTWQSKSIIWSWYNNLTRKCLLVFHQISSFSKTVIFESTNVSFSRIWTIFKKLQPFVSDNGQECELRINKILGRNMLLTNLAVHDHRTIRKIQIEGISHKIYVMRPRHSVQFQNPCIQVYPCFVVC